MLKTISEVLTLSTRFLTDHQIERARRVAEDLISFALRMNRIDLYLQFDRPLVEFELTQVREFLKRCVAGEPIAYIMGEVEFLGCRIQVTRDVLIPRPETEILVDLALKKIKEKMPVNSMFWDLCSGSGCIGLAVKRACPELAVVLSDICPKAAALAKINAAHNHLSIDCRIGDLLQPFENEKADFVICNPPYISNKEFDELDRSVRSFEPSLALLGGCDGVDFYQRLSVELPRFLNPGACLFFEIGHAQGELVQNIFHRPPWRGWQIQKDWSGHDRFFFLEIE